MRVLVSSCFLLPTRYDGKVSSSPEISALIDYLKQADCEIIPFCPEQSGGLATPRIAAEIRESQVINIAGEDVTREFKQGADNAVSLCKFLAVDFAVLKEKSPSCGVRKIYDGSHSNQLISGQGITTKQLAANIPVYSELELDEIKEFVCKQKI